MKKMRWKRSIGGLRAESLNLNADLVNTDNWTVDQIKARTSKIVSGIFALFTL